MYCYQYEAMTSIGIVQSLPKIGLYGDLQPIGKKSTMGDLPMTLTNMTDGVRLIFAKSKHILSIWCDNILGQAHSLKEVSATL